VSDPLCHAVEKEEELVIRMAALAARVDGRGSLSARQLARLRAALVDLHGEVVLCLHWSLLNSGETWAYRSSLAFPYLAWVSPCTHYCIT
jgi:hypothetical protein